MFRLRPPKLMRPLVPISLYRLGSKNLPSRHQQTILTWGEIERRTKTVVQDQLRISGDKINIYARFMENLGADSLDATQLIIGFEEAFQIQIPDNAAEKILTVRDLMKYISSASAAGEGFDIACQVLTFQLGQDGRIEVGLQTSDGSWDFADHDSLLPCGLFVPVFTRLSNQLTVLEEIINDVETNETDIQFFFKQHPEVLEGDISHHIMNRAILVRDLSLNLTETDNSIVLQPIGQSDFCKKLNFERPQSILVMPETSGKTQFYARLLESIQQYRDCGMVFNDYETNEKFRGIYSDSMYKPELQLIVGKTWDVDHMSTLFDKRRKQILIENWDTLVEKMNKKFA